MNIANMTREQLEAAFIAQQQMLAKQATSKLTIKLGKRGNIAVYGLQARFPVTLYAEQWAKLARLMPEIEAFAEANRAALSTGKDDPRYQNVSED